MKFAKFAPVESQQSVAYVVGRCDELCIVLNITKLQKLLYCCYGTVLGGIGQRLVDESSVAGPYGPSFPQRSARSNSSASTLFAGRPRPTPKGCPRPCAR